MKEGLDLKIEEAWKEALDRWHHPSVPRTITPRTTEEVIALGEIGQALQDELAFMKYPEYQIYLNLERIAEQFKEDPSRGVRAISKHELGHRFCPYDLITSIILRHAIKKEIECKKLPYESEAASNLILNLFTDTCINTSLTRASDEDITWAYQELSKDKKDKKLWKVYAKSMELAWNKKLLPEDTKLTEEEIKSAEEIKELFNGNFFDKTKWKNNAIAYARIISNYLEEEQKDKQTALSNTAGNIPQKLDDKTEQELAKRLAEIGSNGLPTNPQGLKEFKEIMAGFGKGDAKEASISFYDKLSEAYNITFAKKPFGRPRTTPFQPTKWNPSMGAERIDIPYSTQVSGGRLIPGVNTYSWNSKPRTIKCGIEEVVPDLDFYLDSSMSMPDPTETISLPVLTGFVIAKKAHRKGAYLRSTNFSGDKQSTTQEWTRDLRSIYRNLVIYYNGGTRFPTEKLLEGERPKQVIIITDTFLANEQETVKAVKELKTRNKNNKVTIYSLHPIDRADYLRNAGAEVIPGTTTDIFKKAIGKAEEVYTR